MPSLGWSGLGFAGSPLATAASRWLMFVLLFSWVFCRGMHKPTFPAGIKCAESFRRHRVKEYFKQAIPLALTGLLEDGQLQVRVIIDTGRINRRI